MLVDRTHSLLLVVDVQERLAPAVYDNARIVDAVARLVEYAALFDVPALVTEHMPAGIGHTVAAVGGRLPVGAVVEKSRFSAPAEPGIADRITALERKQVVICGMEAHVCVLQTALGLSGLGLSVFVVADAVGSRRPSDRSAALERMRNEGCRVVTSEMVGFEWAQRGDHPRFRDMLRLVKQAPLDEGPAFAETRPATTGS